MVNRRLECIMSRFESDELLLTFQFADKQRLKIVRVSVIYFSLHPLH